MMIEKAVDPTPAAGGRVTSTVSKAFWFQEAQE